MITNRLSVDDTWSTRFSAYGAMFVTISVFLLLFMGLGVSGFLSEPPQAFNNLMETVKALAMVCAGYWVGSSNSSQKKDETIATAQTALANSSPVNIINPPQPPDPDSNHPDSNQTTLDLNLQEIQRHR